MTQSRQGAEIRKEVFPKENYGRGEFLLPDTYEKRYEGFGWIKVGRHRDDPALSWEERFRILENHHLKETQFLIDEIRRLAKEYDELIESSENT